MRIIALSGSSRPDSSNEMFLKAIKFLCPQQQVIYYNVIHDLPLFRPEKDRYPWPDKVLSWRTEIQLADAVIISTPEYIHNIPAALKNAMEWLTSSGEMMDKRVLPITFTPHPPRGEKAMQSLLWSLTALKARIVTQLPLYQSEVDFDSNGRIINEEIREILEEAILMLVS
ncbi:MAG: NAD(P)H-dependent oxidoreductase [Saprospiraceae bacterium]|nr:NAD(P)H-dependent oxidoreductase [Saprospiraceae bacterium]